jgi:hypothetical protein
VRRAAAHRRKVRARVASNQRLDAYELQRLANHLWPLASWDPRGRQNEVELLLNPQVGPKGEVLETSCWTPLTQLALEDETTCSERWLHP